MSELLTALGNLTANYEELAAVTLFSIGLCMLLFARNLIKKVIGLDIMDTGVFLLLASRGYISGRTVPIITDGVTDPARYINPIPAGLVLTGIVVSVSVSAVMLALTVRIYRKYRTLNIDQLYDDGSAAEGGGRMSFVQNFPFFSIILSLVCAVISFAAGEKRARQLTVFLLTASVIMQASLLAYCARNHTSYAYMMGHYPAPWGNEITAGVLEPLMALLFAAVMLCSVGGGLTRILRDVAPRRRTLYWVVVDLAHVSLIALCYTNDIFTGYVFIEICTIASCALLCARDRGRCLIASVRYMIFSLIGSGLFLIGVIYTYSITGHLLFPNLHAAIGALWLEGTYRFSMTVAIGLMSDRKSVV